MVVDVHFMNFHFHWPPSDSIGPSAPSAPRAPMHGSRWRPSHLPFPDLHLLWQVDETGYFVGVQPSAWHWWSSFVVSASAGHSRLPEGGTANPYEEQPKGCTPTVMSPFFALKRHLCQTCQSRTTVFSGVHSQPHLPTLTLLKTKCNFVFQV